MLDTNICIYVLDGSLSHLAAKFDAEAASLCISSVTVAELWYGVEKSAPERRETNITGLVRLLARLEILEFDGDAAVHFGGIRATLERAGTPCGSYDMLIGAHARSLGMTLVTNNRRGFDGMPGLTVENWA
jgi:tRNA(fMet)-specific endonuclease VapC